MLLMQVPSVVEQKATIFVANMCTKYQIIQNIKQVKKNRKIRKQQQNICQNLLRPAWLFSDQNKIYTSRYHKCVEQIA